MNDGLFASNIKIQNKIFVNFCVSRKQKTKSYHFCSENFQKKFCKIKKTPPQSQAMIILLYKIGKSTVYFLFLFLFLHLQRIIFAHPIEVQNTSILDFNRVCKKINYLPVLPVATSSSSSYQYATSTRPVV